MYPDRSKSPVAGRVGPWTPIKVRTIHRQRTTPDGFPLPVTECGIPLSWLDDASEMATLGSLSGTGICRACLHVLRWSQTAKPAD